MLGIRGLQKKFREKVPRMTAPREAILGLLSRSSGHLSAKEIHAALYVARPDLGLTTVYRTLELLSRLGLVRKVDTGDGQGRYELKTESGAGHHHHLICTRCGRIIDYRDFVREEQDLVRKTAEALAKKHNFLIHDHNIEFLGLCERCR